MNFSKQARENNIQTYGSFFKLKCPFRKTNAGQMALSYIVPTIWRKTPDMLKRTNSLNRFKHNLKEHYLKLVSAIFYNFFHQMIAL